MPPRAVISAGPASSGLAPLTVAFSAAGSSPAGAITGYRWDLGNGAKASTATTSTSYTTPGRYTAQLMVASNGFTSGTVTEIVVARPFTATVAVTRYARTDGSFNAVATVSAVRDSAGRMLLPSPLSVRWSGAVQATDAKSGNPRSGLSFVSPATRDASACFTFTLATVTAMNPDPAQPPASNANPRVADLYLPSAPISATACPQQASR